MGAAARVGAVQSLLLNMQVCQRLRLAMAARRMCAMYLQSDSGPKERARDVLFLDIALAAHARTTVESSLDALSAFLDTAFAPGRAPLTCGRHPPHAGTCNAPASPEPPGHRSPPPTHASVPLSRSYPVSCSCARLGSMRPGSVFSAP